MNKIKLSLFPSIATASLTDIIPIITTNPTFENKKVTVAGLFSGFISGSSVSSSYSVNSDFAKSASYSITSSYVMSSSMFPFEWTRSLILNSLSLTRTDTASFDTIDPMLQLIYNTPVSSAEVATVVYGYLINTGATASLGGHGVGVIGRGQDTLIGQNDLVGTEGRIDSFGPSGSHCSFLGISNWSGASFANRIIYGQIQRVEIRSVADTGSAVNEGSAISYYAPSIVGGDPANKWSFYGADPIRTRQSIRCFNSDDSHQILFFITGSDTYIQSTSKIWLTPVPTEYVILNDCLGIIPIINKTRLGNETLGLRFNADIIVGTSSQSPTSAGIGALRWNNGSSSLEVSDGSIWNSLVLSNNTFDVLFRNITSSIVSASTHIGNLTGTASYSISSSYVDYASVGNKPTLVSSSLQFTNTSDVLFRNITASIISASQITGSVSGTSSYSVSSSYSFSSSVTVSSSYSFSSSVTVSSSYALTASRANSSSYAISSSLCTSSSLSVSSSLSQTSSFLRNATVSGSLVFNSNLSLFSTQSIVTASAILDVINGNTFSVAKWLISIKSGSNFRASEIISSWDTASALLQTTESITNNIGVSNVVTMSVVVSSSTIILSATCSNASNWTVKFGRQSV